MDQEIYNAARDFVIRVLRGDGTAQETAVLPDIIQIIKIDENAPSGD